MRLYELVIDQWTALSHKEALSPTREGSANRLVWSWVGDHSRRLTAYKLLAAYQRNAARYFLPLGTTDKDRGNRREYGDAALIVSQVRGALLGDDQVIVVDGADDEQDPEGEQALTPEQERQEWLRTWAVNARLPLKMIEAEDHAVGLGDGVYHLAWSPRKRRVTVTVFDPGFYFPVLTDDPDEDYPSTVHIAWEFETVEPDGKVSRNVRRITWRLGPILRPLGEDGNPLPLPSGDRVGRNGMIVRTLPYQEAGEDPAELTCYMTDATWSLGQDTPARVDDFDPAKASFAVNEDGSLVRDLDLRIDFLPLIHTPNTVAGAAHYGTSAIDKVLQILDDLQGTDTDLQAAAATTGTPPLALTGGSTSGDTLTYGPGQIFTVPVGGRMDVLDTSSSLDALLKLLEKLLKRLSVNSRVPDAVLGRVDTASVQAGIILTLSFGPLTQMVREMRLVRDEKYPLMLKMVQRLAIVHGALTMPVMPARIALGSYLPSDRAGAVAEVTGLLNAKAISTETAVRMLMEAGLPIDDAAEEVARIEHENFTAAVALLDALGDEGAVAAYLGRDLPAGPPAPPITVTPPVPPAGEGS